MENPNQQEQFVKNATPFILAGLFILAIVLFEDLTAGFMMLAAFGLGWSVAKNRLPFGRSLEDRRAMGRNVLFKMEEQFVREVLSELNAGQKLRAIKMVRAKGDLPLSDAHEAVELLADFGLRWRDSRDKPPR